MRLIVLLLCLIVILPATSLEQEKEKPSLEEFAALAAAEQFLLHLDQGNYATSWDKTSASFQEKTVLEYWEGRIEHLRSQYGQFKGRQLRFKKQLTDPEGAPKGDYFYMIYGSNFERKEKIMETVTVVQEKDGRWLVSGYSIE